MIQALKTSDSQNLNASVVTMNGGYHFMLTKSGKRRRETEEHVMFQQLFTATELRTLRDLLSSALSTRIAS